MLVSVVVAGHVYISPVHPVITPAVVRGHAVAPVFASLAVSDGLVKRSPEDGEEGEAEPEPESEPEPTDD